MSRKYLMTLVVVGVCSVTFFWGPRKEMQSAADLGAVESREYRLLYIGPGQPREPIELQVGDMLQIAPFTYPLVPDFVNASLKVQIKGAHALELIGQASTSVDGEGRAGRSAFLYARANGQTTVTAKLLDNKGHEVEDEQTSYTVVVRDKIEHAPSRGRASKR
jgi:hypothetical protein